MVRHALTGKYPSKFYKDMSADKHVSLKYLSPFDKNSTPPNLPAGGSLGNFLTVDNKSTFDVPTSTSDPLLILFQPSVRGAVNLAGYNLATGVAIANSSQWSTHNKYSVSDTPAVSKCLRAGIRLNNVSSAQNRDSIVRVLSISSPLEFEFQSSTSCDFTTTFASELLTMARTHPKARTYTAEDLSTGTNELVVSPATNASYMSYGTELYNNSTTCTATQNQYRQASKDMAMNHVLIVLEPSNVVNKYTFTAMTQDAFRYPANTLLGALMSAHPTDNTGRTIQSIEHVRDNGSVLSEAPSEPVPTQSFFIGSPKAKADPKAKAKAKAKPKARATKASQTAIGGTGYV